MTYQELIKAKENPGLFLPAMWDEEGGQHEPTGFTAWVHNTKL